MNGKEKLVNKIFTVNAEFQQDLKMEKESINSAHKRRELLGALQNYFVSIIEIRNELAHLEKSANESDNLQEIRDVLWSFETFCNRIYYRLLESNIELKANSSENHTGIKNNYQY